MVGRTLVAKKAPKIVYVIKLLPEAESSRWKVFIDVLGPTKVPTIETLHPNEWVARNWAERIATSWEMDGKEWVVAEESL
jgi:hypothetical protein